MMIKKNLNAWLWAFVSINVGFLYGESIVTVASTGNVGQYTSLQLDGSGFPVISFDDALNLDLLLAHCNDADCAGNNESVVTVESANLVGQYTSLALDSSGFPVISYYDSTNGDLKLTHCNDANCAGNNESILTVDSIGLVGQHTSLKLDSSGFPVIAYYDVTGGNLKLAHCNDVNCAGNNESIVTIDSTGDIGQYASLRLDSTGNPVISYYDLTNGDLKLVHCNDANCAGNNESIVTVDSTGNVGVNTSLELDNAGYPVISYHDVNNTDLKVLHCNDVNCAGNDESIVTPDSVGNIGQFTSLKLDSQGYPVVAYYDTTNGDLKVLHCNDANCAGNNESIVTPDSIGFVGQFPSLMLDSVGYPVISYLGSTNFDLKLIHCDDPNCGTNSAPVANAGGPYQGLEGQGILLNGTGSSDADSNPLTYLWSVDDVLLCSFDDATLAMPLLTCTDNGVHTVTLVVNDGIDNSPPSSAQVTVNNQNPQCLSLVTDFSSIRVGSTITLTATFSDAGTNDTHQALWEFHDGSPDVNIPNALSPLQQTHTYNEKGYFAVTLTVTDDDNGVCSREIFILVQARKHRRGGSGGGTGNWGFYPGGPVIPPVIGDDGEVVGEENPIKPADKDNLKNAEVAPTPAPMEEESFFGCATYDGSLGAPFLIVLMLAFFRRKRS